MRAAPECVGELAQIDVLLKELTAIEPCRELTAIEPCRKSREPARCAFVYVCYEHPHTALLRGLCLSPCLFFARNASAESSTTINRHPASAPAATYDDAAYRKFN